MTMTIRKVGVISAGLMGGGIAQTSTQSGYETLMCEVNQELLDKGMARIHNAWDSMVSKGKLPQGQADENRSRLHGTLNLEDFADCDVVIEVILEQMEEKLRLFTTLDRILKPAARFQWPDQGMNYLTSQRHSATVSPPVPTARLHQ